MGVASFFQQDWVACVYLVAVEMEVATPETTSQSLKKEEYHISFAVLTFDP